MTADTPPPESSTPVSAQIPAVLQYPLNASSSASGRGSSAALQGASLAFSKPPVQPKPLVNTYSGTNGALAAASKAGINGHISYYSTPHGSAGKRIERSPEGRGSAGPGNAPLSAAQQSVVRGRANELVKAGNLNLSIPKESNSKSSRESSPSNIAASIAAARFISQHPQRNSVELRPQGTARRMQHSHSSTESLPNLSKAQPSLVLERTDSASIEPTNSLIELFERNSRKSIEVTAAALRPTGVPPVIRSPKPIRPASSSSSTSLTAALAASSRAPRSHAVDTVPSRPASANVARSRRAIIPAGGSDEPHTDQGATVAKRSRPSPPPVRRKRNSIAVPESSTEIRSPPTPPPTRKTGKVQRLEDASAPQGPGSDPVPAQKSHSQATSKEERPRSLPRSETSRPTGSQAGLAQKARPLRNESSTALGLHHSISSTSLPPPTSKPPLLVNDQSSRSKDTSWMHKPVSKLHPHLTGDALANAIVASSLASTRAPSPAKSPPPLPSRHNSKHHFFHHHSDKPRTPSPAKGMRQTMRKPPKSDDDEDESAGVKRKAYRNNLIKKHPNKHHEGDRKRWRDQITERERKRYEGVWAANRGIFVGPISAAAITPEPGTVASTENMVSALVVRDIWSRSRLGGEVLEEVWDLVDRQGVGALTKVEFVVGMWLIDQRLKGRKLPVRVSPSVWDSVSRLTGVKVRSM